MRIRHWAFILGVVCPLLFSARLHGQPAETASPADCTLLRDRSSRATAKHVLSSVTKQVTHMRSHALVGATSFDQAPDTGSIDAYIFADLQDNGIAPAPKTTDWEFIRRISLDLTGRIPAPARVLSFVSDTSPDKRVKLIEELLAKPEWVDKWTMYFGDLYKNTSIIQSANVYRNSLGRNAFYQWIYDSLSQGRPYNQMASDLITASAGDTYSDGALNWLVSGFVLQAPKQDVADQMTANVFDTFLGLAHVNCVLCHDGRGHLDGVSLWGGSATRYQSWQLASFFSHTKSTQGSGLSWMFQDDLPGYDSDYALNTTTGNRPVRKPSDACDAGTSCNYVAPQYIFTGDSPQPGENYRVALARNVTGDFQFARATVNYIWSEFFGRGIVDPTNGFDPARLDPDNPPPDPWTLQPSNALLLNALAQHFIDGGYNLKSLMREIANSETYQLSSRYDGEWNPEWEPYFARKFVRRLWAEEVHDAVVDTSGILPSYDVPDFKGSPVNHAMKLPDVAGVPTHDVSANRFLDAFLRGDRDLNRRGGDGTISQALSLMNSQFVDSHLQTDGPAANQLIVKNLDMSNPDLVKTLFLNILSRYPSSDELDKSTAALPAASGSARAQAVQDLVWSLYNKVDFVFNY
jgi:hypothetical protein